MVNYIANGNYIQDLFVGGGRGGGGGGVRERLKWTKAIEMHSLSSEPFIPGCIPCDSRAEETPWSSKIYSKGLRSRRSTKAKI